ncbi:MAG: transporter substrate-binding domain-containing protein [Alphaproteobacteria bacterium]|nr:transporter substrate-binding domain-containing protein [Alphaproteobacteria bacterium]
MSDAATGAIGMITPPKFYKAATALMALMLYASAAVAQSACGGYTVAKGDTLASIATTAYGAANFQGILNANIAVITDPTNLTVGTVLAIPCADGRLTKTDELTTYVTGDTLEIAGGTAGANQPHIKFVTGGDWFPFADQKLEDGGMLLRLVKNAMTRGGNTTPYTIDWVDDWDSHRTSLLPSGAYDISIAWYTPDCSDLTGMTEMTKEFCTQFDFSASLYDAVFGFFTRADNKYAQAKTFADLKGARFCRPAGYSFQDIESQGLKEPEITISIPDTISDCIEGLMSGTYDVFSVESQAVPPALAAHGIGTEVVENSRINTIQSISAMAYKSNPFGRQYLTYLNRGLNDMRKSGEWYDIVAASLKEAAEISK